MAYVNFCSAKEILPKIARNTGGKLPSQYMDDILEWIAEGIDLLSNTRTLITKSTPSCGEGKALQVVNHVVCLPKDLISVLAVEDENGCVIRAGGDITDLPSRTERYDVNFTDSNARATVFAVNPMTHQTQDGTPTTKPGPVVPLYGQDIQQVSLYKGSSYYKIVGHYLQTSFETGFVKLHYLARPLDAEGYPQIPDNENFKTALYWYVLMMLIGAGYEHKVFDYETCSEKYEKYGARAINEITYPSLDDTARMNRTWVRLMPPTNFYSDFFINS